VLAVHTTVVAVVAPDGAHGALDEVHAANVRVVQSDPGAPAFERAAAVWEQAHRTTAPYLLHDADPLTLVADAWARRFEGHGVAGDLEVAVTATLARWRARSLDLPDYYLVIDAEDLRPTLRHWFLGVLGAAAPTRVVAGRSSVPLLDHLSGLRPGPWWPDLDRVLADLDRLTPEQAGGLGVPAAGPEILEPRRHLATR